MTRWAQGWLLILVVIAVAIVALSACTVTPRDRFAGWTADPQAFEMPVTTFAIFPF